MKLLNRLHLLKMCLYSAKQCFRKVEAKCDVLYITDREMIGCCVDQNNVPTLPSIQGES